MDTGSSPPFNYQHETRRVAIASNDRVRTCGKGVAERDIGCASCAKNAACRSANWRRGLELSATPLFHSSKRAVDESHRIDIFFGPTPSTSRWKSSLGRLRPLM